MRRVWPERQPPQQEPVQPSLVRRVSARQPLGLRPVQPASLWRLPALSQHWPRRPAQPLVRQMLRDWIRQAQMGVPIAQWVQGAQRMSQPASRRQRARLEPSEPERSGLVPQPVHGWRKRQQPWLQRRRQRPLHPNADAPGSGQRPEMARKPEIAEPTSPWAGLRRQWDAHLPSRRDPDDERRTSPLRVRVSVLARSSFPVRPAP